MNYQQSQLKPEFDRLVLEYDRRYLSYDPLMVVKQYTEPLDVEIVGIVASSLAYGNVKQILGSLSRIVDGLGTRPSICISHGKNLRFLSKFQHRWTRGKDVERLLQLAARMIDKHGSIKDYFLQSYNPTDHDIGPSLARFIASLRKLDRRGSWESKNGSPGFRHLLPSPSDGSTCKRLNMFLRWMVRPSDGIDLGLWRDISPRQLVMPVDTHVARICRHLRLAHRKSTDWKFAMEVTGSFREMDADDPIRYDFAISHWAIVHGWSKVRDEIDQRIQISGIR